MDPLIKRSLQTGLVTSAELATAGNVDEALVINALLGTGGLDPVSSGLMMELCTARYREKRYEYVHDPVITKQHGNRKADSRGSINIPVAFRRSVGTNIYKMTEGIDAFGNPILIISGAHYPEPALTPPSEVGAMPPPEEVPS